jgi:hypothetical protein
MGDRRPPLEAEGRGGPRPHSPTAFSEAAYQQVRDKLDVTSQVAARETRTARRSESCCGPRLGIDRCDMPTVLSLTVLLHQCGRNVRL